MKILWVSPWLPITGDDSAFPFILHPALALQKNDNMLRLVKVESCLRYLHQRVMLARWRWQGEKSLPLGINVRTVLYPRIPRLRFLKTSYKLFRWAVDPRLAQEIIAFSPDVVHAHTEWGAYAAVPAARAAGVPVVMTIHAGDVTPEVLELSQWRGLLARTMNAADRVLLVGTPLYEFVDRFGPRPDKVSVLPNGFHLDHQVASARRDWQGPLRLISVSLLRQGKGVDISLRSVAKAIHEFGIPMRYEVIGDGPERARLERMAAQLDVADVVTFHGLLRHPVAMSMLADSNVFILPSYIESFGVAHLEAMASGLVTIAVAGQGPSDFIEHGVTGFLVPPRNVDVIARTLQQVHLNREQAADIAERGRAAAHAKYTWENHACRLAEIYESVIREHSAL